LNLARAAAIGAGCSAAIVATFLWFGRDELAAPRPARAPAAAPPRYVAGWTAPAAAPAAAARAPTPARAALARAFHGVAPARALLERLVAGDVGAVARELGVQGDAASAVQLFDLAALCANEARAPPDGVATDERTALEAATAAPGGHDALGALIDARHQWSGRFAAGCAAASFDAGRIRRGLETAAARGDAASLERLASLDAQPYARLQSAALLGNARAQFRLALAYVAQQPPLARSWLEPAAKGDADAEAYYGGCLLSGCFGAPDPGAARTELAAAARGGSLYALGLLASSDAAGGVRHWSRADTFAAPVPPRDTEALGLEPAAAYAWSALDAELAADGCFGFEFGIAAEALDAQARFERALRPAELDAARAAAAELASTSGGAVRHALGCD
jgi:hypothetical protein